MKKLNVNLVPSASRFQLQKLRLTKTLRKAAFWAVIVWALIAFLLIITRLVLAQRKRAYLNDQKQATLSLEEFSSQVELQQALRLRLKIAAEVLNQRPLFTEKVERILDLLPEDSSIKTLKIKKGQLNVGGSIDSLEGVQFFEGKLAKARKDEDYRIIYLKSLTQGDQGWDFSLEIFETKKE